MFYLPKVGISEGTSMTRANRKRTNAYRSTRSSVGTLSTLSDDPSETLLAMLADHVRTTPTRLAVIDGMSEVTFEALWQQSGQIADSLCQHGVSAGSIVGVHLQASAHLVAVVWGILRCGAAYLPLDPEYPIERLRFMIENSELGFVVLAQENRLDLPQNVVSFAFDELTANDHTAASQVLTAEDGDLPAYVIYTSGSTGNPKGVVIPRSAIDSQMRWVRDELCVASGSRMLLKTPTSFDAAQWELLANATGATVVVAPTGAHRQPNLICELIERHRVSALQCVPTLWRALLREERFGPELGLTKLFSGGETLTTDLARSLLDRLGDTPIVNLYGPTETTINATWSITTLRNIAPSGSVGIGKAVRGCVIHVLDQTTLRPVAQGAVGELCISGTQLAVGYLHRPDLTNERFVNVEIDGKDVRVYRTGDLCSTNPDGSYTYVGRLDDQVKVNGHRVELDEVKLAIESHPWVRAACVVPWNGADELVRLAAFVELDPSQAFLMDGDQAESHHRSKRSGTQTRAQLSSGSNRTFASDASHVFLPNSAGTAEQRSIAFERKSYRFFDGGVVHSDDVLKTVRMIHKIPSRTRPGQGDGCFTLEHLSHLLRWLGPFRSRRRLLPKFTYASPGALYATQIYVETVAVPGLVDGIHYFDRENHALVACHADQALGTGSEPAEARIHLHLVGIPDVVEAVYSTNVDEVLHLEAGHLLGAAEYGAAKLGFGLQYCERVIPDSVLPDGRALLSACVELVPMSVPTTQVEVQAHASDLCGDVETFIQIHGKVDGLERGFYRFTDRLEWLGREVVERNQVIAINQQVYDRSSFGLSLRCPNTQNAQAFVQLGVALQRAQFNQVRVGLMSAGYSSASGRDLPSAIRLRQLLNVGNEAEAHSYFAVGGSVSVEQMVSEEMREDVVHVRGPQEILRDDLRTKLPHYMVPSRVEVVDALPSSTSGKVDRSGLISRLEKITPTLTAANPPVTDVEVGVLEVWSSVLGADKTCVTTDFFQVGGNSIDAVEFVCRVNERFDVELPVQTLFTSPTVREVATLIGVPKRSLRTDRLVPLCEGSGDPVVIWPGLGGYPMNLRGLAKTLSAGRPVFGVQSLGLNGGERPFDDFCALVEADVALLEVSFPGRRVSLVGYSFGARVATEVGATLTTRGWNLNEVVLVAPGSPRVSAETAANDPVDFSNQEFRNVLLSVYFGRLRYDLASRIHDVKSLCAEVTRELPALPAELVKRIGRVGSSQYAMRQSFSANNVRKLAGLIVVVLAANDKPWFGASFNDELDQDDALHRLDVDHYEILHTAGLSKLRDALRPCELLSV